MPRGGPRPNSGRPTKAQAAEKARLLAETIAKGPKTTPRAYLQGVLDSPGSTKSEKMRAAELLMKCPPEASPASSDSPTVVWNIWGLPRGAQMGDDGKTVVWPSGDVTDPPELRPYDASPDWTTQPALTDRTAELVLEEVGEPVPFETVEAAPPQNVLPLRPHERGLSFGARHDPSRRSEPMDPFRVKPRD